MLGRSGGTSFSSLGSVYFAASLPFLFSGLVVSLAIEKPPLAGQFAWYTLPLFAAGIAWMIARCRRSAAARILAVAVLAYPLGDCVAACADMHVLRSLPGLPGLILLAACGAVAAYRWLHARRIIFAHAAVGAMAIAVVGLSSDPTKPSYDVAKYLQTQGFQIIPVNPALTEVLGEKAYPDLRSIPGAIDVVDIFRKPDAVPEIVEQAIAKQAKVVWMQPGAESEAAIGFCQASGISVVQGECIMMYAEPVTGFHGFHRWLRKVFGKMPK